MEVVLAESAGFCFGVKRAVDTDYEEIEKGGIIYTFGPIIHNKEVVNDFLKKGVKERTDTGNLIVSDYIKINDYRIQEQTLQDEVTSTIYGADVNKMLRVASPLHRLERYLLPKVPSI